MQTDTDALALRLGQLLVARQGWLATAESCTGGLLAGAATAVAGSSAWFEQGWVTYSNGAKHVQLGVPKDTLVQFGAVSKEVAEAMAAGVLAHSPPATLALTTTGIAGPGGGTAHKPVGLVWFGFAQRLPSGIVVHATSKVFEGDRSAVRHASVAFALQSACDLLTS
ncbi:nicotinamide-nucleotide amidohydrolase family protein [Alcaligenaceae bacterium LF4-65]|jgi:nicotinamide-nucleotide amidase|uniref:Nicotinamide-nucleotide amidohydrolase family protein n=1 Tax=Zwartia hollandica TaxID=324606 RepID=A0A953N653_9BURK|nr:nicotinamide-nucleotide amidohydrolase family protein [Zwartia hollandica]MBZ1349637.1 nicotinamide-nucleotide amidohydrolase family protein [Zwartia hollandica]